MRAAAVDALVAGLTRVAPTPRRGRVRSVQRRAVEEQGVGEGRAVVAEGANVLRRSMLVNHLSRVCRKKCFGCRSMIRVRPRSMDSMIQLGIGLELRRILARSSRKLAVSNSPI